MNCTEQTYAWGSYCTQEAHVCVHAPPSLADRPVNMVGLSGLTGRERLLTIYKRKKL